MSYTDLLSLSFKKWWGNKKYMLLAIIAAIGTGILSLGNSFSTESESEKGLMVFTTYAIIFLVLVLFGFLYVIFVTVPFNIGLTKALDDIENGEPRVGFGQILKYGYSIYLKYIIQTLIYSIPLFLIVFVVTSVLILVFILLLGVIAGANGYSANTSSLANMTADETLKYIGTGGLLLICCLLPIFLIIFFIFTLILQTGTQFAFRALYLDKLGIMESLSKGFGFMFSHLKDSLKVGLTYFLASFILGIPLTVIYFVIGFVSAFSVVITYSLSSASPILAIVVVLVVNAFIVLLNSLMTGSLTVYSTTFYNLAYRKFFPAENRLVNGEQREESAVNITA